MKKLFLNPSTFLLLISALFISSCNKDDDSSSDTPTGGGVVNCSVITVHDDISVTTTWSKGNVYVVNANINVDATLTIQPGAIIKFTNGSSIRTLAASIQAIGTSADPIIFTAYSDDNYCGDSNGDGTASQPAKGFWGGIRLQSTAPSNLTYCKVLYAGSLNSNGADYDQALRVNLNSDGSTINHCTFAHTKGGTNNTRGAVEFEEVYNCTFSNNILYDNGSPILARWCASANFIDASNIFHNPNDPTEKNILQGIYLNDENGGFYRNTQLQVTELPYVLLGSDNDISTGIKLTLVDGVIIKFLPGHELNMNSASNCGIINGQGAGVLFTSITDDTGADSNGDGNLTSPASGDWEGIHDSNISGNDQWCHWSNIHYSSH